jgi:uncharacterized membrane protein (DUF373 family)
LGSKVSTSELKHTNIHERGSRVLELLQDAVVVLLNLMLLGMGFVFLYGVWTEIVAFGDLQEGLANIIFVVITIELYRLSVHYLKDHRVDLSILVEVGVSASIQKVILIGVDQYSMQQLVGISLLLAALGAAARRPRPLQPPDGLSPPPGGGNGQPSPRQHLREAGGPLQEPGHEQGPGGALDHHPRPHGGEPMRL